MDYYTGPNFVRFNENDFDEESLNRMQKILSGILLKSNFNKLDGIECSSRDNQHWSWSNEDLSKFYFLCYALSHYELYGFNKGE